MIKKRLTPLSIIIIPITIFKRLRLKIIANNPNKIFIPNYPQFIQAFRKFLFDYIFEEREYIFEELKSEFRVKSDQILILLNLENELSGLNLPYSEILTNILKSGYDFNEFKVKFLNKIHQFIKNLLLIRDPGSTEIFDLKKLRNTPFIKYANDIINIRKEEFENSIISRFHEQDEIRYDLSEINKTFYGKKIYDILKFQKDSYLKADKFKKFQEFASKLNLKLKIADPSM